MSTIARFSLKYRSREVRQSSRGLARQQGFTLIEIMVVIVIMGILAALIVPRVLDRPDQARQVAARQDIGGIMQALKLYRLDNGRYPTTAQGLRALVEKPKARPTGAAIWISCPTIPGAIPTNT